MSARKVGTLLIVACFVAANAAAQTYTVVDLATLAPGYATVVRGPNSAGEGSGGGILDSAQGTRQGRRALLFEINGARQIAEPARSDNAVIFGLNDAGGYVGSFNTQTGVRAFVGTRAGAPRELPPLGGDSASAAYGLNNRGQAVGFSSGVGGQRAVMWDANGTPAALPGSPDMSRSRATGINERGDVSGVRSTAAGQRPILWGAGQAPAELMLLAGHATGEANAIDARGDVVGYSADASGARRATLWPWSGGVVDLGTLPGGAFSQAFGSNGAGDIVGASTSTVGSRAVLWTRGGMHDLNSLIAPSTFVLTKAVGITAGGMIIAIGHVPVAGHNAVASQGTGAHPHDVDEHDLPVRVFLLVRSGGTR